jgi:hypothetical protein
MIGSWLPENDDFSNSLLTNRDLIELNQYSTNNKEIIRTEQLSVWTASHIEKKLNYLAVFNLSDSIQNITVNQEISGFTPSENTRDIWSKESVSIVNPGNIRFVLQPHASSIIMTEN